ncbi:uncharacterized protein UV8b_05486 [Ustilaginoidea virens]|uniref:Uncharacterized protein n=1 Tax=Ustilaginoidea virens TaxID=1159556 RepID=A0A8E5MI56_USTVR|nr:uncharacterized protein UV8b_05486 [Ustilaginoidea virens]QUC21243.1 hypothetical protein UV8b_05486 [Ustilaginoidea virens]
MDQGRIKAPFVMRYKYDWDVWYRCIKNKAINDGIWVFIDPATDVILNWPQMPDYTETEPDAAGAVHAPAAESIASPLPSSSSDGTELSITTGVYEHLFMTSVSNRPSERYGPHETSHGDRKEESTWYFKKPQMPRNMPLNTSIQIMNQRLDGGFSEIAATEGSIRGKLRKLHRLVRPDLETLAEIAEETLVRLLGADLDDELDEWLVKLDQLYSRCEALIGSSFIARCNNAVITLLKAIGRRFPKLQSDLRV